MPAVSILQPLPLALVRLDPRRHARRRWRAASIASLLTSPPLSYAPLAGLSLL
jgi:hypothetical protein